MIVFCTTCKNRMQHLAKTLPQNIADNPDDQARFVVVDYNDQNGLADYLKTNHAADMESGKLSVYQYKQPVNFRMAHAKNMAHRLGMLEGGDILVNIDADNYTGAAFTQHIYDLFRHENVFAWSRMIKEGVERLPRGISGRIALTRQAFVLAGGYDEKYNTHSPDDKDLNFRLVRLGFQGMEIHPRFLKAILHTDKMRYKEYPEAAMMQGEDFAVEAGPLVVNGGDIGCGTVYKNFSDTPIHLRPLPTRVFGIGMHKTATTSLHHALRLLGFKSGHWQSAHWAKAIWREMNATGRSATVERFYALCDLPIPMLFRQLDRGYPGSKFILTLRDEWKWLKSVSNHFNPEKNRFRAGWDTDPFSHRVHNLLYGRKDFDATTMLNRYRRHNAEVLEYFRDRPKDLLVLDMDNGDGWEKLCGFLGVSVPDVPYPLIGASGH